RQKIHFDAAEAIALAGFAASAFHVETEAAGFVTSLARVGKHGVEIADGREEAGVGGGIGTRGAADRGLIDANDLVDLFDAGDFAMRARSVVRLVDFAGERAGEDVINQGRFAAAGNARDDDQLAKRKFDIEILQIVFGSAFDAYDLPRAGA